MTFVEELQKDILPFLADEAATSALLKRVLLFLEDGEFIQADAYCEKILDAEPENPLAYLCKLMASRRISSLLDLASAQYIVDNDSSFKKAVRFAPQQMQEHLHQLNMHIYASSIAACRSRAKIHLAHGELKETAQQYHDAVKLWEDSHETLPNADAIHHGLANEVADFNWTLLLHNRQCADDAQLIARSIPIDNERWYLNAVKWADAEKKAYFQSVAADIRFGAHLKCLEYVKSRQTRLAQLWADHYKAAAPDDFLNPIHQALVDTDGFTKFSADAPAGMLKLIRHYNAVYPQGAKELAEILQAYYGKIFQSLLDLTGKEPQAAPASAYPDADTYAIMIAQQEANACAPAEDVIPIQESLPAEVPATDPVWATEAARAITAQMADAVAEGISPYGIVTTYLVAARELTVRYSKKDGIVTEPLLFRFISGYYADAIAKAEPEQAAAIQTKFNDFLIDTVRLPSASAQIVTEASGYMQGSPLPYQIYLARITNNYSVKAEELIPPEVTDQLQKWHRYLDNADPKGNCYWISDQQEAIGAAFAAAEGAVSECRQYTEMLQKSLEAPYQQVLTASGDNRDALSSGWEQKMTALQDHCNEWADALEGELNQVKELNAAKSEPAQKQIKRIEAWQLVLSIGMHMAFVFAVFAFGKALASTLSAAWKLLDAGDAIPMRTAFYALHTAAPLVAGIFALVNGLSAPNLGDKKKTLWLFSLFSILTYVLVYLDIDALIFDPDGIGVYGTNLVAAATLAVIAVGRTLLEFFYCKLGHSTRGHAAQVSCRVGSTAAKVIGLVQTLGCLALTALYICCLMLTL